MNNINYETTMLKYGVSDLFMSELAALMLSNTGLNEAKTLLSKNHEISHIDLKQLFVLASSIASSIMGEELGSICPNMQKERQEIISSAILKFKNKTSVNNSHDVESDAIELIFEEIEEAIFELDDIAI